VFVPGVREEIVHELFTVEPDTPFPRSAAFITGTNVERHRVLSACRHARNDRRNRSALRALSRRCVESCGSTLTAHRPRLLTQRRDRHAQSYGAAFGQYLNGGWMTSLVGIPKNRQLGKGKKPARG
jgi:hypothetical protein